MKFFTVILYDRAGFELTRYEMEGMKRAKAQAKMLLSDDYADMMETSHLRMETRKVAIFAEGERTGLYAPCEWDKHHPAYSEADESLADSTTGGES